MTKEVRALFLILILIVAPFLIYTFLQVRSLDEDEKMAATAYEKQMEAVLFSLNQYADDMMGRWVRQLADHQHPLAKNANMLILGNESIQMLVLKNMETQVDSIYGNDYVTINASTQTGIDHWYSKKDSVLNRLSQYLDAGFQKIQSADDWTPLDGLRPDQTGFTIMVYDQDSVLYNALLIVERKFWIEQILGPRMQEINHEEFSIAVDHWPPSQSAQDMLYRTTAYEPKKNSVKNKLWLLPNTYLFIQSKGKSYTELIKARSQENLYFLIFSLFAVSIGTYLMIRNIRNALKIAQLKSDFVSNVSHEIRTPLSLIRMYAETLMLGRLTSEEKKNHYYQTIHHESGRLTFLVNNILDFSRIEGNRKTYRMEEKNLNHLIKSLHESYGHYFVEKKINCQLTLSDQSLPVSVDEQAFDEAMSNLIENAIKYGNGQQEIFITTFIVSGFACCSIKDQGIGISKSTQKHIFDKFYRVESALTQKTKGTGLGLSLVKHIMESHQGEVVVESRLNLGSTFTLKFPLIKSKDE
ncbi:two-component system, OmpR family, phosphate regulon sensor histidine kinase PhoR [Reichenbachiella faecimaris]|uniref:histidine kinase n=1 Tax=Reichenbachiella faecimaris TaxID=692418 RepID=A0A1W2GBG8_REIFA|nr:ATP-binding protein [Reichenbachiella faecimaris]SMD33864.1 two-component system, OmpR family, phosphate regulon sensor histidine kinase PhoR [Reichenbachiella faecimaris]